MPFPLPRLLLGLALAALAGCLGYRRGALTRGGALGATLVGGATFGLGGPAWGALVIAFFASSSLLSRYRHGDKERFVEKFSKGAQRDLAQVLANGGAAAALAAAHALWPHPALWAAFAGALAAVNADTWATEVGVLSGAQPRLIISGRPVEAGSSGGLTLLGTGAALAGAGWIGLGGALFHWLASGAAAAALAILPAATAGGLCGSLVDSLLGATAQAIYFCPRCGKETERHPAHTCGTQTVLRRGWPWLDNDWVNFLSSLAGAAVAAGVWGVVG